MNKVILSREELYKLVWAEPLTHLAKRFEMSDNGLRKICKKRNIPLPNAGYWQKIRHGKLIKKQKLPINSHGDNTIVFYLGYEKTESTRKLLNSNKDLFTEIQNSRLPTKVPERLSNPDPLIIHAQETLKNKKEDDFSPFKGVIQTNSGQLKIRVSKSNVGRALRFMDTFLKLIQARHHAISYKYNKVVVQINDVDIEFGLVEKMKIVKSQDKYSSQELQPMGILAFTANVFSQKEWKDGTEMIESLLPEILTYLELKSRQVQERRLKYQLQEQLREDEERKKRELIEQKQNELKLFKELLCKAISWQQSKFLREFITALQEDSRNNPERQNWIEWAKKKVDWFDPLVKGPDDLLDNTDRKKLYDELRY